MRQKTSNKDEDMTEKEGLTEIGMGECVWEDIVAVKVTEKLANDKTGWRRSMGMD